jgi:hypothetical protein
MNQELSDLFSQYDIGKTTQANFLKEIFDARDKWWVNKGDEIFQLVPDCWLQSNCGTEQCTCEYQEWQSLKQSLEAK